jgi:hypothetical protein
MNRVNPYHDGKVCCVGGGGAPDGETVVVVELMEL